MFIEKTYSKVFIDKIFDYRISIIEYRSAHVFDGFVKRLVLKS